LIESGVVQTGLGRIAGKSPCAGAVGDTLDVLVRPDDIVPDDLGGFGATIVRKAFKGADILYTLRTSDGVQVLSLFPSHANHRLGETVRVRLQADHLVAFPQ
jgi:iron(III) transport system ATP-binding protein